MSLPPLLLLLLILLLSSQPLSAVTVTHLPGFIGALPFNLETGYVTVDEVNGVELFYYFIESEGSPGEDPVLLWLTGGPGCSAFSGLVFEIVTINGGLLHAVPLVGHPAWSSKFVAARYDGSIPSLVFHQYSWTKVASIIFLDSPVGSGFSFSTNPEGYMVNDTTSTIQIYEFLKKWFIEHPQFLSNDLYISGDSYAGKVVPLVAHEIDEGIQAGHHPILNLKGYIIGNPSTGESRVDYNCRVQYAQGIGIISDELYEVIERNCEGEDYLNPNPLNSLCVSALNKFETFKSEITTGYTLDPKCPIPSPRRMHMSGDRSLYEEHSEVISPPPDLDIKCRGYSYYLSYYWANHYYTRAALHIKKGTVSEWVRCNFSMAYTKNVPSTIIYHLNLTKKGYRVLVYSGDKDLSIPFIGTQMWIRSLNFPVIEEWRSWHVGGQVAGYVTKFSNNLTFTTVKDAGHTAPEYKPENTLMMIKRWLSCKPL